MRVFMLGWEFPPFISGGLGTACYGLTKAMSALGTDVLFLLPRPVPQHNKNNSGKSSVSQNYDDAHLSLVGPAGVVPTVADEEPIRLNDLERVTIRTVHANLNPYGTALEYTEQLEAQQIAADLAQSASAEINIAPAKNVPIYAGDLFAEVQRYATLALDVAQDEAFDVVHAHDWMTCPAAMGVAAQHGKPLVVHVHSTEFDRAGTHIDQRIYDIERRGVHAALRVIAVSHLTKNVLVKHYGVSADKIEVIYNAVDNASVSPFDPQKYQINQGEKLVLFLGRITHQKGPEYFLEAAKKVLEVMGNVKFVMAGSGDMIRSSIEQAASLGIGHRVLFTGFLRGPDVERVYRMADLYVMPSVSEPFGIAPLEAIANDVPVLISKQSGVSEVLPNALKVDFWDTNEMANKIVAVLRHPPLARTLREEGTLDANRLSWADSAQACINIYEQAAAAMK
jgi:glycogen synthase